MKYTSSLLLLLLFAIFINSEAFAASIGHSSQVREFSSGFGVVFGDPTSLTGKTYLNSQNAIDYGLSFANSDYTLLYSDYIVHQTGVLPIQGLEQAVTYMGIGGLLVFSNTSRANNSGVLGKSSGAFGLGARAPFGILTKLHLFPMEIFGELVPCLSIMPTTSLFFEVGVGLRYFL